jgi:hypothetical protein
MPRDLPDNATPRALLANLRGAARAGRADLRDR